MEFEIENGILKTCNGPGGEARVPDGVTGIGPGAFRGCGALTAVTFPADLTEIGCGAFDGCEGLSCTRRTPPSFVGHVVPDVPERRRLQGVPKLHGGRPIPLPAAFLPHNRRFI